MEKIKKALTSKNIITGYLYFYIHFVTEIICFFALARVVGDSIILWFTPLLYDTFAFVPQGLIGYISDKYRKINMALIGTVFLIFGIILFNINSVHIYISIIVIAIGNALIHVMGAETTLRTSDGKLSHSAIFVAGGSFGVVTGKLLGKTNLPFVLLIFLVLTMIPFILLAEEYLKDNKKIEEKQCMNFNYHNTEINPIIIIFLATLIVIVRGYMGYGIPTTWNKTVIQTIILYSFMGIGKALGGILSDAFGIRKIALVSTVVALPFLLIGDNFMIISLIGVMFFSMTMAITLGLLVSVLKTKPGLAFGFTTIGLFLGSIPIFIFKITSIFINGIIISILTILCIFILMKIIRKENIENE